MGSARIAAVLAFASLTALALALPVQAASIRVSCPDCADIPAWAIGLLAVVGILLAMAILWLPQRLARNVASPRTRARIILGGWLILTIAFVFGARALVVALGGT